MATLVILLFVLMVLIEQISIISNVAGKLTRNLSQGLSFQHATFAFSRILLPFILLLLTFMIETAILLKDFIFLSLSMTFTVSIFLFVSIFLVNPIQKFYQKVIFYHHRNTLPISLLYVLTKKDNIELFEFKEKFALRKLSLKKILVASLSYILLGSAFLFSFAIAIYYIEYRLTISQLTSVFQGLATIVLTFYINPMFSRSIDLEISDKLWIYNLYSILFARALAFIVSSAIFVIVYLLILNS